MHAPAMHTATTKLISTTDWLMLAGTEGVDSVHEADECEGQLQTTTGDKLCISASLDSVHAAY